MDTWTGINSLVIFARGHRGATLIQLNCFSLSYWAGLSTAFLVDAAQRLEPDPTN